MREPHDLVTALAVAAKSGPSESVEALVAALTPIVASVVRGVLGSNHTGHALAVRATFVVARARFERLDPEDVEAEVIEIARAMAVRQYLTGAQRHAFA